MPQGSKERPYARGPFATVVSGRPEFIFGRKPGESIYVAPGQIKNLAGTSLLKPGYRLNPQNESLGYSIPIGDLISASTRPTPEDMEKLLDATLQLVRQYTPKARFDIYQGGVLELRNIIKTGQNPTVEQIGEMTVMAREAHSYFAAIELFNAYAHEMPPLLLGSGATYATLFDYLSSPSVLSELKQIYPLLQPTDEVATVIARRATGDTSTMPIPVVSASQPAPIPSPQLSHQPATITVPDLEAIKRDLETLGLQPLQGPSSILSDAERAAFKESEVTDTTGQGDRGRRGTTGGQN